MTIQYYRKNVYGNEVMYIADEHIAYYVNQLTNRVTMTGSDMFALSKLGFEFEEVLAPKAA